MSLNGTSNVMTFEPLSTSQRGGAIVVAVFALLSVLALAFITLRTIRLAIVVFLRRENSTSRPPEILFFRTQLGRYGGCLMLSNMFISAAGLIDFNWAWHSGLSRGSTCSAQAALMQTGIWGTCWFTTVLGVHTLSSFVFHIQARWRSFATVTIGWTIAFVAGLAPLQKSEVYGPNGPSCGITHSYPKDTFALEALPIVLAVFVSTAVFSVIFAVLRGKLSANGISQLRGSNSTNRRGEVRFGEYHGFIITIVWTMFWFPLAFVLLLLPFCITHILMYAGHSVSLTSSVFADVCVCMLGFVNVGLLCNTLRVISPVYCGPRSAKAVAGTAKTLGHDASSESPNVPRHKFLSQSTITSNENSHRTYNPTLPSSNHSRDLSWSTVNSITELLGAEKAPHKSVQTRVAPHSLNDIISPAKLSRQLDGNPGIISAQSSAKKQDIEFQSEDFVDVPLRTASLNPRSLRVSFVTGDTRHKPSTQDQQCSFQLMTDIDAPRKGAKEPPFESKAPVALNPSCSSFLSLPPSPQQVSNKSAILAARLGISAASTRNPSSMSAISSAQKLDQGNARVSAFPVTSIPRIEVNICNPRSSSSSAWTAMDSDSDCSGETTHARKVRPLPPTPKPSDHEQDIIDPYSPISQCMRDQSQRMTVSSVWSQETGYTMSQPPDAENQEVYKKLVANALVPGVMLGDQADVGGVMSRQTTSGSRGARPIKVASKFSARFSDMLNPKSPNEGPHRIAFAPDDSVV